MSVQIGSVQFGDGHLGWIAGPCMLESRDLALTTAQQLATVAADNQIGLVFKGSFDKANRTSAGSERGPGLDAGLEILQAVRDATGLPVITDIHEPAQAEPAGQACDALQIPAFLCRQTDLIAAAAATGKPVLIKKGQFMSPADMQYSVTKADGAPVLLAERGTTFGYGDLVVDMRGLVQMRRFAPVVFDASHACQQPGAARGSSGGQRDYLEPLARAAIAVGIDGLFIEVHPDPDNALSDRQTQIPLAEFAGLVQRLTRTS